jgi:hypothetical protein
MLLSFSQRVEDFRFLYSLLLFFAATSHARGAVLVSMLTKWISSMVVRIFVLSSSSSNFRSVGVDHFFSIGSCSIKVCVDGLAVVDGVKQLTLEHLNSFIRWKLEPEEARPADWESCLSSCFIQLNRVVLNDFLFLQRQSCSAPNESKIADFLFVGEALQDLPKSLDDFMRLRAVSVCCQLL